MKLSTTMQKALDQFINAPYAEYGSMATIFHMNDGYQLPPSCGKYADGTIEVYQSSGTLRALEKRGLIEIVKDGGRHYDKVRLLQHENTSQPLFASCNLVAVDVYVLHHKTGEEIPTGSTEYVEDGNGKNAIAYWSGPMRNQLARVVNQETGEELYSYRG